MKAMIAVLLAGVLAACGPRQVQVGTAPVTSEVSLNVTNTADQAMNIYVNSGGNDLLVGQVPANGTAQLPVSGVASGSTVTLKARTTDGTRTYSKQNVVLSGTYAWTVP